MSNIFAASSPLLKRAGRGHHRVAQGQALFTSRGEFHRQVQASSPTFVVGAKSGASPLYGLAGGLSSGWPKAQRRAAPKNRPLVIDAGCERPALYIASASPTARSGEENDESSPSALSGRIISVTELLPARGLILGGAAALPDEVTHVVLKLPPFAAYLADACAAGSGRGINDPVVNARRISVLVSGDCVSGGTVTLSWVRVPLLICLHLLQACPEITLSVPGDPVK